MVEVAVTSESTPPPPRRLRPDWKRRLLNELFAAFVALLFLAAGALVLLDTAPGHRFIIDRIGRLETASGLKIRIGRIDGSIFGKSQLKNVAVSDQRGIFLTSPNIKLDWAPGAWLRNTLSIDSLTAERVTLIRTPALKPSTKKGPIFRASTFISASSASTVSMSGRGSAERREAEACAARPTFIVDVRWLSLPR